MLGLQFLDGACQYENDIPSPDVLKGEREIEIAQSTSSLKMKYKVVARWLLFLIISR